jgi:O-antigen/teichoic acid export membrane protein
LTPNFENAALASAPAETQSARAEARPGESQLARRLARGASIYVMGLLVGKGLTVVLQIMLGRWLGPAAYGLYALGYTVVALLQWVTSLGLDQGVLRYCALYRAQNRPGQVRATLRRALLLATIASAVVAALLVLTSGKIAARFFTVQFSSVLAIFVLALPCLIVTKIAATYVQSANDILRMTVLQLLARPVTNVVFLAAAIALGLGLEGAVGAYVLCAVAAAALGLYYLARTSPGPAGPRVKTNHSPLMRYSMAMVLVGLSYQVILRISVLLLGHLATSAEVGVYSAGASFALAFGFMPLIFAQPALPMMVELYEASRLDELRELYRKVTRWTLATVLPPFLVLCLFRNEIIWLFGRNFSQGGTVLLILSLGWLIYHGKGPAGGVLEMTGRQNLEVANTAGIAALMVVANALAIPRYGALGAAVATAATIAAWAVVEYVEVRLIYGLSPWSRAARRNLLVAVITAAAAIALSPFLPWVLLFLVAGSLYSSLYLGLCVEPEDRVVARAALDRARAWLRR